jgi:TonB-linked SusC/RagA family outer membrane protein
MQASRDLRRLWRRPWRLGLAALVAAAFTVSPQGLAAQVGTGTVTGRVTDGSTGGPVAQARVLLEGTTNGTLTADNGSFTLRQLPAGSLTLVVSRVGYEQQKVTVTLSAGGSGTADVVLKQAAFSLSAVVATATGQQKKVELANATATINVGEKMAELPAANMGQLLSGRAAGVQVVTTGETGGGSRIRIRGQSSLSLSNNPVVIIDGVRVTGNSGSSAIGVGGATPSRLDDINPEEIESIEVVKGPSAATLYGTEAAAGVINITTKRGRAGKTQYTVYSENGLINDPRQGSYPLLYYGWGQRGATQGQCRLQDRLSGACTRFDSLSSGNVLNSAELSPIASGNRQQYGFQASGGSDRVQFFASAEREAETGIYEMPAYEQERLRTERGVSSLPIEQTRPNALERTNLRLNMTAQLASRATLQVSSGFVQSSQRLPQNNDNANGLMVAAMGGLWRTDLRDSRGVDLRGFRVYPIGDVLSRTTSQDINRFINSAQLRWEPTDWLVARANVGYDLTDRVDKGINLFDQGIFVQPNRSGGISEARTSITQGTVDLGGTATFRLTDWLGSKTSFGTQYISNRFEQTNATAEAMPPGGTQISAGAIRNAGAALDETRTLGYYVEQQFSFNERLFVTAGVRRDAASAFGSEARGVWYPKVGASWVASDEGFFPQFDFVDVLRLRATYGASGQIPGTTDALRFFDAFPATISGGGDAPSVSIGALGNANLRPEYSAEFEGGFDLTLWQGKTNFEFTYYNKKTTDALISRRIAPSLAGVTARFENIGDVRNSGLELVFNQRLLDNKWIYADLAINGSTNRNELITLGEGVSPIPSGNRNTQLNAPGFPLFGLWGNRYTYADTNGDGILAANEMTYESQASFIGPTYPTREFAFSPTVELLDRKLRINAQFDRKWGMLKLNNTLRHMCQGGQSCRGLYDATAPLELQAASRAINDRGFLTGFYEDGSFTRFRELSVSYTMPESWARSLRASRWNVVLTGRNLAVWTPFTGLDPETTVGNSDTRGNEEFFSTPPMRTWTFRMNFSF